MTEAPKLRPVLFYRAAIAIAITGFGYLWLSGRLLAYARALWRPAELSTASFNFHFATAIIWLVSVAPLCLLAWDLGRQHVAARRLGYDIFVGVGQVFRIAFRGTLSRTEREQFARSPTDRPLAAIILGTAVGVGFPLFFLAFVAPLRNGNGLLWLGIAGLMAGSMVYVRRRAAAYVADEPSKWDLFRHYRLLNPRRYDEPGRRFVRLEVALLIALGVWWLGGGCLLVM